MSNIIDSIQLSGVTYTLQGSGGGGTVSSAITSGDTNAVESKAIYDATHIDSFDLWTATDSNNYNNNTQSLYKVYVQYTGDTALDEQVQVEIYYGSNFTREAITGNVYQETASTSSVFTSTFDNGKWIIESSSPNYIRSVYADYRFKIWVFIRAISDNFAADSIKDDIIPYINDVDTIARNAVTGGNLHQGDSNKELRLLLQKGNGGSTSSVMNLDDLKCSYNGTLSTDIQIPTGEIGWTEITPQNNCTAGNMPTNKVKVTYSGQTVSADYRRLQFNAVFATNVNTDYYRVNINWSNTTTPTVNGCSAVTATYDSTDDSVTIELPTGETTYNGSTGTFSIENLRNIYCQFGTGISSVKYYGDITEDIYTAMAHKQNTLSAGTGIEISGNVISATGGGGKAIEAGRGISITTGETADTVSFNLPISAGTNSTNIKGGSTSCVSSGNQSFAFGYNATATSSNSIALGFNLTSSGEASFACGGGNKAIGWYSFAGGSDCNASGNTSLAFGSRILANNNSEASFGRFNASSKASNTFGDSGNTLFSVGNGTANNARHNAFEIRQNGDIYLNDGSKLQDTVSATAANTTALGGLSLVKLTQAQYDALATKDSNVLYVIVG